MASLLDIAPLMEEVHGLTVRGVNARGVASILAKSPELRSVMVGREISADALFTAAPDAVAEIIAAGVGRPGDKDAIAEIDGTWPLDVQLDVLAAVIRVTMPRGPGPFVEALNRVMGGLGAVAPASTAPASKSRKQ